MSCVIVGAGPVGLYAAIVLGSHGIKTTILERNDDVRHHGGATHLAAEVLQNLVRFGVHDIDFIAKPEFRLWKNRKGDDLCFYVPNIEKGPMAALPPVAMIYQGQLEECLLRRALEVADVVFCTEVHKIEEREEEVVVTTSTGQEYVADYCVGADGANSTVRKEMGAALVDFDGGRKHAFCIYDFENCSERNSFYICDPERPMGYFPMPGGRGRIGFWLKESETLEEMMVFRPRILEEAGIVDSSAKIERCATYWLRHKVADKFASRRVFLVGDAAQTMGPFMGQGLNQGLRAATNLAWRIIHKKTDDFEKEMMPSAIKAVRATRAAMYVFSTRSTVKATLRNWVFAPIAKNLIAPLAIAKTMSYAPSDLTDMPGAVKYFSQKKFQGAVGTVMIQPIMEDDRPLFAHFKNQMAFQLVAFNDTPVETHRIPPNLEVHRYNDEKDETMRKWRALYNTPDVVVIRPDLYILATFHFPDLSDFLDGFNKTTF